VVQGKRKEGRNVKMGIFSLGMVAITNVKLNEVGTARSTKAANWITACHLVVMGFVWGKRDAMMEILSLEMAATRNARLRCVTTAQALHQIHQINALEADVIVLRVVSSV
jgi:hypothetical protein